MSSDCVYCELELVIDRDNLISGALKVINQLRKNWLFDRLKFKTFTGGITNQLIGVHHNGDRSDTILIRVYGVNTEHIIDHRNEIRILQFLNTSGFGSRIYATFTNGYAYQYLFGRTLDEQSCYDPMIYPLVAAKMAHLHLQMTKYKQISGVEVKSVLWDKINSFIALGGDTCHEGKSDEQRNLPSKAKLTKELEWLMAHLEKFESPLVLCHNDLLLGNIIYDERSNVVHFIDFEYAGPNYQAYDIANLFNEFSGENQWASYPDENFRRDWVQSYLKVFDNCQDVGESKLKQMLYEIEHFRLASHFFCGTWAAYQATHSKLDFDFISYSNLRLQEYYRVKSALLPSTPLD
ncbi:ethanolamine kinase 2-like isoform X1 [Daphnia pulicaria]|uniref:ethanolamine kinase 2-like isoform X1 n=1 Tax=Daphnia pulicaria TaxID=35523 RepID=UPI001EEC21FF|nr:ethanolamine kinase 2-like isoform X1 [Daphnia pulicaria]